MNVAGDAPRGPAATEALQFEVMRGIRWARVNSRAQPLAGEQLHRLDQRAAVAALAPRQPDQRAFRLVHRDFAGADFVADLAAFEIQMLGAKGVNFAFFVFSFVFLGPDGFLGLARALMAAPARSAAGATRRSSFQAGTIDTPDLMPGIARLRDNSVSS